MADPLYDLINSAGVIVPDTAGLLQDVRNEWTQALGAELVTDPETPQGRLITAEVLAREAVVQNNAKLANQINPNQAGGIFLDAIWALTGGQRQQAIQSIVRGVELRGYPGTQVLSGSLIASNDADSPLWQLLSTVILSASGVGYGDFQAVVAGPTPAAVNTLTRIVSATLGWEQVNNPVAAELGVAEETDLAARRRRRLTLALQGVALPEAIISGLNDTPGVRSCTFRENYTNLPVTIEGVTLGPHSIYACVDGGTDAAVAETLLREKSMGCAWNGGTVVTVTEPISGQDYAVRFDRPTAIPIYMAVTVRMSAPVADPAGAVRAAIMRYVRGEQDGEVGFAVGADVSAFEISGAVNRDYPGLFVQDVKVGTSLGAVNQTNISILINQIGTTVEGFIAVTVLP